MIQSPGSAEDLRRVLAGGDAGRRRLPLLGAFCLFLSTIEYLIPKPLPFMRIGLANLPLMLALDIFPLGTYLLLVLIKVLGQTIVTGTLFSYVFLFSFAGSLVSALSMFALRRFPGPKRLSLAGTGVAGAMLSNGTQLILARFLVFGSGVQFLIPPFLAAGLVTGLALGLFCERFRARSRWYSSRLNQPAPPQGGGMLRPPSNQQPRPEVEPAVRRGMLFSRSGCAGRFNTFLTALKSNLRFGGVSSGLAEQVRPLGTNKRGPECRREGEPPGIFPEAPVRSLRRKTFAGFLEGKGPAAAGLLMGAAFLLNPSLPLRIVQFFFFWLCALVSGRKQRPLLTLSVIAAVVLVNLLAPYGRVLAEIGFLKITGGSLAAGLLKGISLEGLLMLSGAVISSGALDSLYRPRPGHGGVTYSGLTGGPGNGGFGALLGESFRLFGKIGEKKGRIKVKQIIEGIDTLLLELEDEDAKGEDAGKPRAGSGQTPGKNRGRLLLFLGMPLVIALTLLPLLWG